MKREEFFRSPPAGEPASNPAGDLPRTMKTAGAKDTSAELERKNYQLARAKRRKERKQYWEQRFTALAVVPTAPPKPAPRKSSGIRSPMVPMPSDLPPVHFAGRYRSRKERAAELRERMAFFTAIYNAGWLVRDAQSTTTQRLDESVMRFVAVLLQEMRTCRDFEALIYAVADTLTCSKFGVPWEE